MSIPLYLYISISLYLYISVSISLYLYISTSLYRSKACGIRRDSTLLTPEINSRAYGHDGYSAYSRVGYTGLRLPTKMAADALIPIYLLLRYEKNLETKQKKQKRFLDETPKTACNSEHWQCPVIGSVIATKHGCWFLGEQSLCTKQHPRNCMQLGALVVPGNWQCHSY